MTEAEAVKRGLGRIRIDDNSLAWARIRKGDVVLIDVGGKPDADEELCAAFIPVGGGRLVIRRYHEDFDGNVWLTRRPEDKVIQVFAPRALVVFGPVVSVERAKSQKGARGAE